MAALCAETHELCQPIDTTGPTPYLIRSTSESININTDKIHLKSGVICSLSDTTCTDKLGGGQIFWNPVPNDNCNFQKYTVLYEGSAFKTYDNSTTLNP